MISKIFLQLYREDYQSEAKRIGQDSLALAVNELKLILKFIEEVCLTDDLSIIHLITSSVRLPKQISLKLTRIISTENCSSGKEAIENEIKFLENIENFSEVNISGVVSLARKEENASLNMWSILDFLSKVRSRIDDRQITINIVNNLIFAKESRFFIYMSNEKVEKLIAMADLVNQIILQKLPYNVNFRINGIAYNSVSSETVINNWNNIVIPHSLRIDYFQGYTSVKFVYTSSSLDLIFERDPATSEIYRFEESTWLYSSSFETYGGQEESVKTDIESILTGWSGISSSGQFVFNSVLKKIETLRYNNSYEEYKAANPDTRLTEEQYYILIQIIPLIFLILNFKNRSMTEEQKNFLKDLLSQNGISSQEQESLFLVFSENFPDIPSEEIDLLFSVLMIIFVLLWGASTQSISSSLGRMTVSGACKTMGFCA